MIVAKTAATIKMTENDYQVSFDSQTTSYVDIVHVVLSDHGDNPKDQDTGVIRRLLQWTTAYSHGDRGQYGVKLLGNVVRVEHCALYQRASSYRTRAHE